MRRQLLLFHQLALLLASRVALRICSTSVDLFGWYSKPSRKGMVSVRRAVPSRLSLPKRSQTNGLISRAYRRAAPTSASERPRAPHSPLALAGAGGRLFRVLRSKRSHARSPHRSAGGALGHPYRHSFSAWTPHPMTDAMDDLAGTDRHHLERFVHAQASCYDRALSEMASGRKQSHWMWYVFPQIEGLGWSATARRYAIRDLDEARAYLHHPVLGRRLNDCAETLLRQQGTCARHIFGVTDEMKLRSCMTLFACAAPPQSIFDRVLSRFFPAGPDLETLRLLAPDGP